MPCDTNNQKRSVFEVRTGFKRAAAGLAAMCLTLLALSIPTEAGLKRGTYEFSGEVVGYYAGWAAYQGFTPDQIPAEELTQVNYAFAQIDPDSGTIMLEDQTQDKKNLAALRKLRTRNPQLKLLISVGGWSDSKYFSDVASTKARRETFAASCAAFAAEYGLDGVDLDWEYPVSGGAPGTIHRPTDKQNFTLLLRELRTQLDRQGRRDGKTYSLTIAGAAGAWYLNQIEAMQVADIVDHIFLMGYDLHGTWDTYADLNARLYTPSAASPQSKTSISACVQSYLNKGIPAEKIVLGMPLYGYALTECSRKTVFRERRHTWNSQKSLVRSFPRSGVPVCRTTRCFSLICSMRRANPSAALRLPPIPSARARANGLSCPAAVPHVLPSTKMRRWIWSLSASSTM